jgi:hypothetical protein
MKDLMHFTTSLYRAHFYTVLYIYYFVCGGGFYLWVGGRGGGGLLFFRIHVKGVIEFFCDAGGGAGHFV